MFWSRRQSRPSTRKQWEKRAIHIPYRINDIFLLGIFPAIPNFSLTLGNLFNEKKQDLNAAVAAGQLPPSLTQGSFPADMESMVGAGGAAGSVMLSPQNLNRLFPPIPPDVRNFRKRTRGDNDDAMSLVSSKRSDMKEVQASEMKEKMVSYTSSFISEVQAMCAQV